MKTRYTVALSMIAGAALGGAAIQGLHAKRRKPGVIRQAGKTSSPCGPRGPSPVWHTLSRVWPNSCLVAWSSAPPG